MDLMNEEFDRERGITSQGNSELNQGEMPMEIDTSHQDLHHTPKKTNSIVPFCQNQNANFDGIPSVSPELRNKIRLYSSKTRNDSTTGLCSTNDKVHLT